VSLPGEAAILVAAALAEGAVERAGRQELTPGTRALGVAGVAAAVPRVEQLPRARTGRHWLTHAPPLTRAGPAVRHETLMYRS
jgi:hypothetical protein